MTKPTTYVLVVTDMSGSMSGLEVEIRGGLNNYIADLRKDKEANGTRYRVSLTVFDTQFEPLCTAARLADVPELTEGNYAPRGMTALLDAVGKTVMEFGTAVTLSPEDRVLLVIQTDGEENSSQEFGWPAIKALLEAKEKTGQWAIVYLGQGVNAWSQGGRFGQGVQVVNSYNTKGSTSAHYSGLTMSTLDYSKGGSSRSVGETIANTPGVTDPNAPATS
jgi:uncharacterized protein YegL